MLGIINQIKILIQYRHLLWNLALKDIKVKYRSPTLGFLWAIIVPLIMVFVFKFVFSTILKARVEGYPFFIYIMTAIFPWAYFSSSVNGAIDSIVSNKELIKKTYFPRQIIPVSVVLASLLNFLPALIVMLLILVFFRIQFTFLILFLPVIILLQTTLAVGIALIVSALQVILRDVKYIVELLLMTWFYLSPGFYSLNMVANLSERFLKLYMLNPFVGLFTLYRTVLLKGFVETLPSGINIFYLSIWTSIVCLVTFLLGFFVFKKYDSLLSDLV